MSPDVSASLREQARRDRMSRILQAAESLFAERSYDSVTTRELAARAGVGEATLFRYVISKPDLLLMVVGDRVARLIDQLEAEEAKVRFSDGRSYVDRIYAIYDARAAQYRDSPDTIRAFALKGLNVDPDPRIDGSFASEPPRSMVEGDRVIAMVTRLLSAGQDVGVLSGAFEPSIVALNCNGAYVHEVVRSPARGHTPDSFSHRLQRRLMNQLEPLLNDKVDSIGAVET